MIECSVHTCNNSFIGEGYFFQIEIHEAIQNTEYVLLSDEGNGEYEQLDAFKVMYLLPHEEGMALHFWMQLQDVPERNCMYSLIRLPEGEVNAELVKSWKFDANSNTIAEIERVK